MAVADGGIETQVGGRRDCEQVAFPLLQRAAERLAPEVGHPAVLERVEEALQVRERVGEAVGEEVSLIRSLEAKRKRENVLPIVPWRAVIVDALWRQALPVRPCRRADDRRHPVAEEGLGL